MHFKQDRMTSKERMNALFQNIKPDRVPIGSLSIGFQLINCGYTLGDAYEDAEKSFWATKWTAEQYGWDPISQLSMTAVFGTEDFGGKVRAPKSVYERNLVVESYPVQDEKDVDQLKMPDPKTAGRIPIAMRFAQLQAEHDLPVFFASRSPFTMAADISGVAQFCKWLLKKPELCERLISLALEHITNVLRYWVETFGSERVYTWMIAPTESNQVVSPRLMAKFAIPPIVEYHKRVQAMGIKRFGFHICGEQNLNLPILSEVSPWTHPSVLSFGHEVDLDVAAKYFPQDIIYGNIEPAVIQTGSPEDIYRLCRVAIEKGKKAPGGFVLGPSCGFPISPPPVNVYAMTKAVHDFGWYE
jgi:uroporphyrinogen decarboxylase